MSSQIQQIKKLITAYEEFLETNPANDSVEGFKEVLSSNSPNSSNEFGGQIREVSYREQNRALLAIKGSLKPVIQGSQLSSLDDYYLLLDVQENPRLLKKQLINGLGLEYSTGVEMVARLKKRGILKESFAPGDKRSRLVELSPKGIIAVNDFTKQYNEISNEKEG